MISVSQKIKGYITFELLLLIKNLEISIKELQNVKEENNKMEEEEKKLSAEEMSKRWERLAWEMDLLANKRVILQRDNIIYWHIPRLEDLYRNIQQRITEGFRTIRQLNSDLDRFLFFVEAGR